MFRCLATTLYCHLKVCLLHSYTECDTSQEGKKVSGTNVASTVEEEKLHVLSMNNTKVRKLSISHNFINRILPKTGGFDYSSPT